MVSSSIAHLLFSVIVKLLALDSPMERVASLSFESQKPIFLSASNFLFVTFPKTFMFDFLDLV